MEVAVCHLLLMEIRKFLLLWVYSRGNMFAKLRAFSLQCFDTVGWVTGRAFGLQKSDVRLLVVMI